MVAVQLVPARHIARVKSRDEIGAGWIRDENRQWPTDFPSFIQASVRGFCGRPHLLADIPSPGFSMYDINETMGWGARRR